MKRIALASMLMLGAALAACQSPPPEPPDHRAESEAAIRNAIKQWNAAAAAKDADAFASFYADDAVLMLEEAPDARGKEALRTTIGTLMQDPAFALTFEPDRVVAARSDDLAYETGSYSLTLSGADGNPQTQPGHYSVVWEKQADGSWKAKVDVPVSGPPTDAPTP